jgi:gamma-glutamyltranspeptidase/glutathione hydrolase
MEFSTGGILDQSRIVRRSDARRQCAATTRHAIALAALLLAASGLGGCSTVEDVLGFGSSESGTAAAPATPEPAAPMETDSIAVHTHYLGSLAADDPQAVDIGRQILQSRGTAADAAAAMGLALTVTLPSRAGLDGAGICLVHEPGQATVEELDFVPPAVTSASAQIPGVVRGLALLQARDGVLHWQQAVGLAEKQAQTGIAVTGALLADLNTIGMAGGLKLGDVLPQRSVAATLARLRVAGASDFYTGELAARLVEAGVPKADLARWLPSWRTAALETDGDKQLYLPDGAGGQLARAAWQALAKQVPGDPVAAFAAVRPAAGSAAAVASFVASDARGEAVGCAIGMGGAFGTGKLIAGLDVYAAAPVDAATLAPIIALSGSDLVGVFAGGGGQAAPAAAAATAWLVLMREQPLDTVLAALHGSADAPDRLNALACPGGSPRHVETCLAASDPRGGGYAMSADRF